MTVTLEDLLIAECIRDSHDCAACRAHFSADGLLCSTCDLARTAQTTIDAAREGR